MTDLTQVQTLIAEECDSVKALLLAKNREYGNAALEPITVFSSLDPEEQIAVRIDDKLQRIRTTRRLAAIGEEVRIHEDTERDLIGYLVLLRVARRLHAACAGTVATEKAAPGHPPGCGMVSRTPCCERDHNKDGNCDRHPGGTR